MIEGFTDECNGLSTEQIGAFACLISEAIRLRRGVPMDTRRLSGLFNCSPRKANSLIEALIVAGKVEMRNAHIWPAMAISALKTASEVSERARASANYRWKKQDDKKIISNKNKDVTDATALRPHQNAQKQADKKIIVSENNEMTDATASEPRAHAHARKRDLYINNSNPVELDLSASPQNPEERLDLFGDSPKPSKYFFEGKIFRLTKKSLQDLDRRYPDIYDITEVARQADDFYADNPDAAAWKSQKRWFTLTQWCKREDDRQRTNRQQAEKRNRRPGVAL